MAYKTPSTKVTGFFAPVVDTAKRIKEKVIDGVSDAISTIPRRDAQESADDADKKIADIKKERKNKEYQPTLRERKRLATDTEESDNQA